MVNFDLLTAEICWRVWGTPANFKGFLRVLAALLHGTLVMGVSQTLQCGTEGATQGWIIHEAGEAEASGPGPRYGPGPPGTRKFTK